jgi:hypothetical protein
MNKLKKFAIAAGLTLAATAGIAGGGQVAAANLSNETTAQAYTATKCYYYWQPYPYNKYQECYIDYSFSEEVFAGKRDGWHHRMVYPLVENYWTRG